MQSQGGGRDSAVAFAPRSSCSSLLLEQQWGEQQGRRGGRCREQKEGASSSQSSEPWQHPAARAGVAKLFLTREHRREIHLIHQKKGKNPPFLSFLSQVGFSQAPGIGGVGNGSWNAVTSGNLLFSLPVKSTCTKTRKSHLSSFPSLSEWFYQPQQEQFFLIPCSCCDNTRKYPWNEPLAFVQEWPLTSAGVINRARGALWGNHKAA